MSGATRNRSAEQRTGVWARRIHVYTSMIALVIVLFFATTGLIMNHPDWVFGNNTTTATIDGEFPIDITTPSGTVDFLAVAEYARTDQGVVGDVTGYDYSTDSGEGTISFANPGYTATVIFNTVDSTYDLSVTQDGFVAMMNDLHTGNNAGASWGWAIDVSAVFLMVISLSGLLIQAVMRKRRRSAMITAAVGAVVTVIAMVLTIL